MWRRIITLARKEFLALLKEPKSRVVIIVPPILQLLVFGYAATFDLHNVPYAVYDEDGGEAAQELLAGFSGSTNFREAARVTHQEEIAPLVDSQRVLTVVHVGRSFSRDLTLGRPAPVQVIVDGRNSNTAMLAVNYAGDIVSAFSARWAAAHGGPALPATLETRAWFNPNLESRWFLVPGIVGLLTLLVTLLVTALSVAREREQGTFDQLLVTPLRPVEILIGKALPGFVIGVGEATFITTVAILWFHIPFRGSFATYYAGIALYVLAAIGVGLMISSLAVTMQQGLLGAFLFMVPAIILSGFVTPIANMPPPVQALTYLDPVRYFMVVLRGEFLEGTPFHLLIGQFWPLAAIGLVSLTAAGWLFRHRMY
jgi:ABC-2 type transport system permease protein